MDYSSVKNIPFKGYARAYEKTDKRLFCDPETGEETIKEEKIIQFGELVENKKDLPDYHEYSIGISKSRYIGIVKVSIEPDQRK